MIETCFLEKEIPIFLKAKHTPALKVTLTENWNFLHIKSKVLVLQKYTGERITP